MSSRKWTIKETDTMVEMFTKGASLSDVADALDRTENGVAKHRYKVLGGSVRPGKLWTAEDDTLLRRLYEEGWRDPRIAEQMDRSEASIAGRRKVLDLTREVKFAKLEPKVDPKDNLYAMWSAANRRLRARLAG